MTSAPSHGLPKFYNEVVPLDGERHGDWRLRSSANSPWVVGHNTIPLLASEFVSAQRNYPIVFSSAGLPAPLALMGLSKRNDFFDDKGQAIGKFYIPAYVRRYPFILAKLGSEAENLTLCFDPGCGLLGKFEDGALLFEGDSPSEKTNQIVKFCQDFDTSAAFTQKFVKELQKFDLLVEGNATVKNGHGSAKPTRYAGFLIVDEKRLRDVDGSQLKEWCRNGVMSMIMAHLHSLNLVSALAERRSN